MKWIANIRLKIVTGFLVIAGILHFQTSFAQPRTLSISSIVQLEPLIINDTTDFQLTLGVHHSITFVPDSMYGDIFYYYQTDSMIATSIPPRIINNVVNNEWINDQEIDIISIDIRPDEIRSGDPINLIVVWPAMNNPNVSDSSGIAYQVFAEGYMGEPGYNIPPGANIIFPCPAIQFIYINPSEMNQIKQIDILGINGSIIASYISEEFNGGSINLKDLPPGNYFVTIHYFDNRVVQTKLLKY